MPYRDSALGRWAGTEWQLTARLFPGHTILFGGEYRDHWREYQESYYDVEPRVYDVLHQGSSSILGLYAQDEVKLQDDLLLTAGLRFDHYSNNFGSTVNPRLGLIYNASPTATFKALYGQAFRAPNPFEHYYNPEQHNRPELQPEQIRTYELAYEQYLGRRYRVGIVAYYYNVDELITQAATDAGAQYFANLADVRAAGIELEAEGRFESGVQVGGSYTLQRARDEDGGYDLSSSPHHLGKLYLTTPLYRNLAGSLELQYNASSRTIRAGRSDDFLLANLTLLTHQPMRGLDASLGIHNLLDTRYGYPGSADHIQDVIEQDGRSVVGKLTYKF